MATLWISVLTIGVLTLGKCCAQESVGPCSEVNTLVIDPGNCYNFLSCTTWGLVRMNCPASLVFNQDTQRCDYITAVPRCQNGQIQDACNPSPCFRGDCTLTTSNSLGYVCNCYSGYTGANCDRDVNECNSSSNLCQRGVCINTAGSFQCDCGNSGYSGRYCEIPPAEQPCIDGKICVNGKCQPGPNSNTCLCNTGFDGKFCDNTIIGVCASRPCQNDGRCSLLNGGYFCNCTGTGFFGSTCTNIEPYCSPNPCSHGRCISTAARVACDCTGSGYEGVLCDIPVQVNRTNCYPGACTNGECVNQGQSYSCNCAGTVYMGPQCLLTACNFQNNNPCMNGGTCIPQLRETYTCSCPSGFTGGNCETLITPSNCPVKYQCPSDVPRYNYPAWEDANCSSYYNCEFGVAEKRFCQSWQKFDVVTMVCKDTVDRLAVFCDYFRN